MTRALAAEVEGLDLVPQGPVGSIGCADLVDYRLRLVIECDSWAFHSGKQPFKNDVRRYSQMVAAGWAVIRVLWEDVTNRPEWVRHLVERTVARLEQKPHSSFVDGVRPAGSCALAAELCGFRGSAGLQAE